MKTADVLKGKMAKSCVLPQKEQRSNLFKETGAWKIKNRGSKSVPGESEAANFRLQQQLKFSKTKSNMALDPFDRHHALYDGRLGDRFASQSLESAWHRTSVFFDTGNGAACKTALRLRYLPTCLTQNFFHGRHGMIFPLYRDAAGTEPNVHRWSARCVGQGIWRYSLGGGSCGLCLCASGRASYTRRFWNELETPGPARAADEGQRLVRRSRRARKQADLAAYLCGALSGAGSRE